ncbi:hypothetical protein, partial [Atlantibacter subterraneus]|uniref:hypothetical protein n=1 Tax=Atlantibacter subterraneus TaxID=255519 RepID=UPI002FDD13BD
NAVTDAKHPARGTLSRAGLWIIFPAVICPFPFVLPPALKYNYTFLLHINSLAGMVYSRRVNGDPE